MRVAAGLWSFGMVPSACREARTYGCGMLARVVVVGNAYEQRVSYQAKGRKRGYSRLRIDMPLDLARHC